MLRIAINNEVSSFGYSPLINIVARQAARIEKKIVGIVEINIVGEHAIKTLNKNYRGQNKVTDVLSFAWQEEGFVKSEVLGQVYLCYPQVKRHAKIFGVTIKEETARMLAHGLLHLVGHDHHSAVGSEKMFALQEEIVRLSLK